MITTFDSTPPDGGQRLVGCRCVVTGAAGFFGPYLVAGLLAEGVSAVRALDLRDVCPALRDICTGSAGRAIFIRVDLCGPAAHLEHAMEGADVIFHCAAMIGSFRKREICPREEECAVWDANLGGTTATLEAAARGGARAFVYCSTVNVAFTGRSEIVGGTEEDPPPPPSEHLEA